MVILVTPLVTKVRQLKHAIFYYIFVTSGVTSITKKKIPKSFLSIIIFGRKDDNQNLT